MIKSFILDTNVIAHSERGNAIFGFDDNNVIITGTTMQELDRKQTQISDITSVELFMSLMICAKKET